MLRQVAVVTACALVLLCFALPAAAQDPAAPVSPGVSSEVFEPDVVVDPDTAEPEPGTVPGGAPDEGGSIDDEPLLDEDDNTSNTELQTPGYGNAADQSVGAKQEEIRQVEEKCLSNRPPTSTMLGLPGTVGGDEDGWWGWLLILIAGGLLLVAGLGFLLVKNRSRNNPIWSLSTAAATIGIVSGLAGLVVQFVPGVGVNEHPPPEATMEVRQVHSRITRAEYARKTGSELRLQPADRREVGNVIWVEVRVRGYQDRSPALQYALYDSGAAGALLPGTAKRIDLKPEDRDVETLLVPIWVGYPKSDAFEAQFRLLDGEQVEQMASTGRMKGSTYRYSCERV